MMNKIKIVAELEPGQRDSALEESLKKQWEKKTKSLINRCQFQLTIIVYKNKYIVKTRVHLGAQNFGHQSESYSLFEAIRNNEVRMNQRLLNFKSQGNVA